MRRRSPGVRFPPLLLFIFGFIIGILLNRIWPLSLLPTGSQVMRITLGWSVVGISFVLVASAMITFRRKHTGIYPNQPATGIVTSGPYRFSRNPMYLALTLAYLGCVLLTNTVWPLLLLPVVLAVLWVFVIHREEVYLAEAFGSEYEEYCKRVRRWF